MRAVASLLTLLSLAAGCASPMGPRQDVDQVFVLRRAYLHPAVPINEWALRNDFGRDLDEAFGSLSCEAPRNLNLLFRLRARLQDGRGAGRIEILLGTPDGAGDPCEGEGEEIIQPASWIDPDADEREAQLSGPAFVEGRTLEGRVNLGDFSFVDLHLGQLPRWWTFNMTVEGNRGDDRAPLRLTDAEARAVWSISGLELQPVEAPTTPPEERDFPEGTSSLQVLVFDQFQPDVDRDGDGLERVELENRDDRDNPAPIARCIDGDGTVIEGPDCAHDPRIVDAYAIRLVFGLEPAVVTRGL